MKNKYLIILGLVVVLSIQSGACTVWGGEFASEVSETDVVKPTGGCSKCAQIARSCSTGKCGQASNIKVKETVKDEIKAIINIPTPENDYYRDLGSGSVQPMKNKGM